MRGPALPVPARRAAVAFIFVTVLLDMVAVGIIVPVLPNLLKDFLGGDTARAAGWLGLFGTVWALMQFLCSPVVGALSDRFGRRPVVLLSNLGLGLDYVFMALAPSLGWLFAGRIISGITTSSVPTAFAYIADVTPAERRAKAFGMVGAAFGVGFIVGPALGGLLGGLSPRLPFWASAGMSLANAMYGFFVLPESLPRDRRSAFRLARASPIGSLNLLRSHPRLLALAAVHLLYFLAQQALPAVFVLYAGYRYGWGTRSVGFALAGVGVSFMIVQGLLVGPAVGRFGERRAVLIGLCSGAAGLLIYGLASTSGMFILGLPASALWGLYGPAMQGLASRHVGPGEQGQLQGALASIGGISGVVGPTLFAQTFALFIGAARGWHLPGAPFLLAALLLLTALVMAGRATREGAPF